MRTARHPLSSRSAARLERSRSPRRHEAEHSWLARPPPGRRQAAPPARAPAAPPRAATATQIVSTDCTGSATSLALGQVITGLSGTSLCIAGGTSGGDFALVQY